MTKQHHVGRRSNDFPDIAVYTYSVLDAAYEYYECLINKGSKDINRKFQHRFNMTPSNAAILVSAVKFKHEMKKKGICSGKA